MRVSVLKPSYVVLESSDLWCCRQDDSSRDQSPQPLQIQTEALLAANVVTTIRDKRLVHVPLLTIIMTHRLHAIHKSLVQLGWKLFSFLTTDNKPNCFTRSVTSRMELTIVILQFGKRPSS
jgi:hypothetical protein